MPPAFDSQPELFGTLLQLRPLQAEDLEALYLAASDPKTWAGHPASTRYQREVFEPYARTLLESEATLAVIDRATDRIIGCSRYYVTPDEPEAICIGFTFLNNAYWGGGTNLELKRLMLDHAFQTFSEVWLHVAPTNIRSQKAVAKLGAEYISNRILHHSGPPALSMCFRLTQKAWEIACQARSKLPRV